MVKTGNSYLIIFRGVYATKEIQIASFNTSNTVNYVPEILFGKSADSQYLFNIAFIIISLIQGRLIKNQVRYFEFENVNLTFGPSSDVINILGMSTPLDITLGEGDNGVYVSSSANVSSFNTRNVSISTGTLNCILTKCIFQLSLLSRLFSRYKL